MAAAATLINSAKKPMAGRAGLSWVKHNKNCDFLGKADIPAGRTLLGCQLFRDHPLNVGIWYAWELCSNVKQQECDVLIAIGMRFSDRVTGRLILMLTGWLFIWI